MMESRLLTPEIPAAILELLNELEKIDFDCGSWGLANEIAEILATAPTLHRTGYLSPQGLSNLNKGAGAFVFSEQTGRDIPLWASREVSDALN